MNKPADITDAAWDEAYLVYDISPDGHGGVEYTEARQLVARAIMAATPKWQPMETAPTDGTKVIVWEEGEMHIAWSNGGGWVRQGDDYNLVVCPSHWMPLPVPPQ